VLFFCAVDEGLGACAGVGAAGEDAVGSVLLLNGESGCLFEDVVV